MTAPHEHSQSLQWYDRDWQPVGEPIEVRDWAEVRAEAHRRGLTGPGDAHCCLPSRPNPNDRQRVHLLNKPTGVTAELLTNPGQSIREFAAALFRLAQWDGLEISRPESGGVLVPVAVIRDGRIVWAEQ